MSLVTDWEVERNNAGLTHYPCDCYRDEKHQASAPGTHCRFCGTDWPCSAAATVPSLVDRLTDLLGDVETALAAVSVVGVWFGTCRRCGRMHGSGWYDVINSAHYEKRPSVYGRRSFLEQAEVRS